ncbi:MAG: pilus assembly protein N-terminal domain-containing protein [Rhizobiaceae bacterium]
MKSNVNRCLLGTLATLFVATMSAGAAEGTIDVVLNQAKIVKLSRAADTIVIGNPDIADAAVKDSRTIVITGKYFGTTNFVVLDAKGNPIVDQQISVSRSVDNTVNVYRQANVQTLSCTPYCEGVYKSEIENKVADETN